jgi:uncharacterized protein
MSEPQEFNVADAVLTADRSGAVWWAEKRLLAVADLHFEKGSAFAVRTGQMLPPYGRRTAPAQDDRLSWRQFS